MFGDRFSIPPKFHPNLLDFPSNFSHFSILFPRCFPIFPVASGCHPPQRGGLSTALGSSATSGGHAMPPGPIRQWSASESAESGVGVAGRDPALDALINRIRSAFKWSTSPTFNKYFHNILVNFLMLLWSLLELLSIWFLAVWWTKSKTLPHRIN